MAQAAWPMVVPWLPNYLHLARREPPAVDVAHHKSGTTEVLQRYGIFASTEGNLHIFASIAHVTWLYKSSVSGG